MSNKPMYLTAEGLQKLKDELLYLKETKRLDISTRLRIAIQQGDLSENADYIATKEEQGFVEGRIQELEYIVSNAVVIEDSNRPKDEVGLGCRVTIREEDFDPEVYHVVGANEANPREGRISNESPIGRALMGKKKGAKVNVETPSGKITFTIVNIE